MELSKKLTGSAGEATAYILGNSNSSSLPTSRSSFWGQAEPFKEAVYLKEDPKES